MYKKHLLGCMRLFTAQTIFHNVPNITEITWYLLPCLSCIVTVRPTIYGINYPVISTYANSLELIDIRANDNALVFPNYLYRPIPPGDCFQS